MTAAQSDYEEDKARPNPHGFSMQNMPRINYKRSNSAQNLTDNNNGVNSLNSTSKMSNRT